MINVPTSWKLTLSPSSGKTREQMRALMASLDRLKLFFINTHRFFSVIFSKYWNSVLTRASSESLSFFQAHHSFHDSVFFFSGRFGLFEKYGYSV
jgi:hypothetical protein